jgi:serine/threonine protein kinase
MSKPNRSNAPSDFQPEAEPTLDSKNATVCAGETASPNLEDGPQLLALANDLKLAIASPTFDSEQIPVRAELVQRALVQAQEQLETSPEHLEQTVDISSANSPPVWAANPELNLKQLIGKSLGQYQINRILGHGGMGIVCEARDTKLQRSIALKLMHPKAANVPDNRARFVREAQAAAQLMHDHICPIYQVGEFDDLPFIAMPMLSGETLDQRMRTKPLAIPQALEVIRQITDGLVAAHRAGLIHRDIKPSNIWLENRPNQEIRIRILDFGLARFESDENELTQSGTILGTPSYMAPEQARGESVGQQADLFSLGAVMYELLVGKKAFSGASTVNILTSILSHDPPEASSVNSDIPESLSRIVSQLLQKKPEHRTKSAAELAKQLAEVQPELHPNPCRLTSQTASDSSQLTVGGKARQTSAGRFRLPPVRLLWTLAGFAAAAVLLTGILLFKTPQGTLLVEFDDSIDIRVKDGKLNVYDELGALRYSLAPSEGPQKIAAGKYQVKVTGADGLSLNTDSFEMKRGEQVVLKVSSVAAEEPKDLADQPSATTTAEIVFPGKSIISDDFTDPEETQLRLGTAGLLTSQLENGCYVVKMAAKQANDKLTLPIGTGMNAGAFATRCRSQNGNLFFNLVSRNDGRQSRFLSLIIRNGTALLLLQRLDLENGNWQLKPGTRLKVDDKINAALMDGKWITVAARWNSQDFDIWLNDQQLAGGVLPTEELLIGKAMPIQFCVSSSEGGDVELELDYLKVWDQADLSSAGSAPTGLPPAPTR